jgi:hypothetical protein
MKFKSKIIIAVIIVVGLLLFVRFPLSLIGVGIVIIVLWIQSRRNLDWKQNTKRGWGK